MSLCMHCTCKYSPGNFKLPVVLVPVCVCVCWVQVCRLKERNEELSREREAAVCSLEREVQRCRSVEDHFDTLRANHQQMIEIKDQYKQESSALRARLEALSSDRQTEEERAAALTRHRSEVAELRGELEQARCCAASAEDRCR